MYNTMEDRWRKYSSRMWYDINLQFSLVKSETKYLKNKNKTSMEKIWVIKNCLLVKMWIMHFLFDYVVKISISCVRLLVERGHWDSKIIFIIQIFLKCKTIWNLKFVIRFSNLSLSKKKNIKWSNSRTAKRLQDYICRFFYYNSSIINN